MQVQLDLKRNVSAGLVPKEKEIEIPEGSKSREFP